MNAGPPSGDCARRAGCGRRARHLLASATGVLAATAVAPASASAHGLVGRADLPIPTWLFGWAAAAVLCVSFAALAVLWPRPWLEPDTFRPLGAGLSRVLTSRAVDVGCGAVGVALLALVVVGGFAGEDIANDNIVPTFVYVAFWLGLVPLSLVFGDVFRAFNPWRAIGRAVGALTAGRAPAPLPYPERLGRWPAALGLLGFGFLELVSSTGDKPSTVATAAAVYTALTLVAMAVYGVEPWIRHGEAFSVYFNLFSRLSPFERRGDTVGIRRPLSGLTSLDAIPGTVGVVSVMIGVVSFDGLSSGPSWQSALAPVVDGLRDLGLGARAALELPYGIALLAVVGIILTFYRLGVAGVHSIDPRRDPAVLARTFVHSLVPIALAYSAAHYFSLLVFQGQALAALASDPLGRGADLFGTASWGIDYAVLGATAIWYIQVLFVVAGHVAGLALAHDRALVLYGNGRTAVRSQYWMLAVMVGFTSLALWLLSEASKG